MLTLVAHEIGVMSFGVAGCGGEVAVVNSAFQDVYAQCCGELGKRLEADGFRYVKTGPSVKRKVKEWDFRIRFQSSTRNSAGRIVVNVWISAHSRILQLYREQRGADQSDGYLWQGNLGLLRPNGGYREWNLWHSPALVVNTIENLIRSDVLPLFTRCSALTNSALEPGTLPFSRHELSILHPADTIDLLMAYHADGLIDGYLHGLSRSFVGSRSHGALQPNLEHGVAVVLAPQGSNFNGRMLADARALFAAGSAGEPTARMVQALRLIEALDRAGRTEVLTGTG